MIDLTDLAGYPLKFDEESCGLSLDARLRRPGYSTRELDALRPVLLDPDCDGPEVIYWMYRDICRPEDAALGEAHGLRYDLSAFRSVMLGREYMKTSGHYHPPIPGTRAAYPEVYEVLYGEALYVMQRIADYCAAAAETTVEDVIVARVRAGQKIVMPPGYGHVTINTLDRPLLMSNWVSNRFASFYGSVEEARGFAWYLVEDAGQPRWIPNERYGRGVPFLRFAEVREVPELGLTWDVPMYQACAQAPEKFAFLNEPARFEREIWANLEFT